MKVKVSILVMLLLLAVTIALAIIIANKETSEKVKTEVKNDFLKIPEYTVEDNSVKTIVSPPKPIDTGDVSYWFVVVQKNDGSMFNTMIQQNHKGFSMSEAKAEFKGSKVFILNFIQVSKETWDINQ